MVSRLESGLLENRCLLEECSALFCRAEATQLLYCHVRQCVQFSMVEQMTYMYIYIYMHLSRRKWILSHCVTYIPNSGY